jgi:hypothetical protein
VRYLVKSKLHKLFPSRFRAQLLKFLLFSIPQSSTLKAVWPSNTIERFIQEVEEDVKGFLKAHGKPDDFYRFQRAEV